MKNTQRKSVIDLREGDKIIRSNKVWIVGSQLKSFTRTDVRFTATPEHDLPELSNGEYTAFTLDKGMYIDVLES